MFRRICTFFSIALAVLILISVQASAQVVFVVEGESNTPNAYTNTLLRFDGPGSPPTVVASGFYNPNGLALDASHNLYVADDYHGQIAKFSSDGSSLGIFASGLPLPGQIAVDSVGNVFVTSADPYNKVYKFAPSGQSLGSFSSLGNRAYGIAIDTSDNVYVSNALDNTIRKFSNSGQYLGLFATTGLNYTTGLAFDRTGNLYAANEAGGTIEKFSSSGMDLGVFATTSGSPFNLAFDSEGDLFVGLETPGHSIRKFSPTGQDLGDFATGLEAPGGIAILPTAVSVDLRLSNITATRTNPTSALVSWTTSTPASSIVEYGVTPYTSSTSDATLVTNHSVTLNSLTANTLYHFRVKSTDAVGKTVVSGDFTFAVVTSGGNGVWSYTITRQQDQSYLVKGSLTNRGSIFDSSAYWSNVVLTKVQLGGAVWPSAFGLGFVNPGQTANFTLSFPASAGQPGAMATLTFAGTYDHAYFGTAGLSGSFRVQLP